MSFWLTSDEFETAKSAYVTASKEYHRENRDGFDFFTPIHDSIGFHDTWDAFDIASQIQAQRRQAGERD